MICIDWETPLLRAMIWTILAIGTVCAAAPAMAQTYDPNYPVCIEIYSPRGGGYIDCSYISIAQCNATASGRGARCYANPYFAFASRKRPPRR
jgi:hypothetical protein